MRNVILILIILFISITSLTASTDLNKSRCVGKCNQELRSEFEKCRKDNPVDTDKKGICFDLARERFRVCVEKCRIENQ